MHEEIWKDVVGYEGYYQVSNLGNVRSLDRYIKYPCGKKQFVEGKPIQKHVTKHGYYKVVFTVQGKSKNMLLHRVVAQAFLKNTQNHPQVNHIDEDKLNNNVENLEWCSNEYNAMYSRGIAVKGTHLKSGRILYFNSSREAEQYGFIGNHIMNCAKQDSTRWNTHKGYKWELIEREITNE